jgi:hypothetical protein
VVAVTAKNGDRAGRAAGALADAGAVVEGLSDDRLRGAQQAVANYVKTYVPPPEQRDELRELLQMLGILRAPPGWHPERGTIFGYWWHVNHDETPCLECWNARIAELEKVWGGQCPMIPG